MATKFFSWVKSLWARSYPASQEKNSGRGMEITIQKKNGGAIIGSSLDQEDLVSPNKTTLQNLQPYSALLHSSQTVTLDYAGFVESIYMLRNYKLVIQKIESLLLGFLNLFFPEPGIDLMMIENRGDLKGNLDAFPLDLLGKTSNNYIGFKDHVFVDLKGVPGFSLLGAPRVRLYT